MLYLIGGAPRCGKTTFAKLLSQKLNCAFISADDVRKEEIEKLGATAKEKFPFEATYANDNDIFFQNYSAEEILAGEIKEAHSLWPRMEEIIEASLKQNSNAIIEGVQLLPDFLEKYKNNSNVKIVFFYKKDEQLISEGFHKSKDEEDWLLINTKDPVTFEKAAKTYSLYGKYFETEAKKHGFESVNMEHDFTEKLKTLLQSVRI
jgi:2-phosphoglycerate kinase